MKLLFDMNLSPKLADLLMSSGIESVNAGIVVLAECDELWAFGDRVTETMRLELQVADGLSIPMKFFNNACEGVIDLDSLR